MLSIDPGVIKNPSPVQDDHYVKQSLSGEESIMLTTFNGKSPKRRHTYFISTMN